MSDNLLYEKIGAELKEQIVNGQIKPGDKTPSVNDIRKKYDVSHVTALRVFKELAQENIVDSIKGKGYFVKSIVPRMTRRDLKRVVACVIRPPRKATLHDNYFNDVNHAIQKRCASEDFDVIYPRCNIRLKEYHPDEKALDDVRAKILDMENAVDGFLLDERVDDKTINKLKDHTDKPLVLVGRTSSAGIDAVSPDNVNGARKAAELALKMNYGNFIICRNLAFKENLDERVDAFVKLLKISGTPPNHIHEIGYDIGPYEETLARIKEELAGNRKNLVFSPSDSFARWLTDAFGDIGASFGEDIGIMGFGGMGYSTLRNPHVFTMDVHPELIGEKAVDLLIGRIKGTAIQKPSNLAVEATCFLGETI